jgi:hypothetical protein
MSESLVAQIFDAAKVLERLQGLGPAVNQKAYSPRDLRNIARMLTGEGER